MHTLYSCAVLFIWCLGVMPILDTAYAMMEQTPMWHIVSNTGNLQRCSRLMAAGATEQNSSASQASSTLKASQTSAQAFVTIMISSM